MCPIVFARPEKSDNGGKPMRHDPTVRNGDAVSREPRLEINSCLLVKVALRLQHQTKTKDFRTMREEQEPPGNGRAAAWTIGAIALSAWFVILWLMFGDVL